MSFRKFQLATSLKQQKLSKLYESAGLSLSQFSSWRLAVFNLLVDTSDEKWDRDETADSNDIMSQRELTKILKINLITKLNKKKWIWNMVCDFTIINLLLTRPFCIITFNVCFDSHAAMYVPLSGWVSSALNHVWLLWKLNINIFVTLSSGCLNQFFSIFFRFFII